MPLPRPAAAPFHAPLPPCVWFTCLLCGAAECLQLLQLAGHNVVEELEDGRLAQSEEQVRTRHACVQACMPPPPS